MPKLVEEIVLIKSMFESDDASEVVDAVKLFAHGLNQRFITDDEMPENVVQSSCVSYYHLQVLNGDVGQFVTNSQWKPSIVEGVRTGLHSMGASRHAELFADVVRFVDETRSELEEALRDDDVAGYWDKLNAIRGDYFDEFVKHSDGYDAGCSFLTHANAAWIRGWPHVKLVSPEMFNAELDRLASVIPDLEARKKRAHENSPWQIRRIIEVSAAADQSFVRVNALGAIVHDGVGYPCWHITTDQGHHHVVFRDQLAILYRGKTEEVVARISASEATSDRELEGWEKRAVEELSGGGR
jgi:hypothetical protein